MPVLDHAGTSILGAVAYAIGLAWLLVPRFGSEFLKAFIYDRLLSTLNPSLVEYGPSLAMAGLGSYLFWLSNGKSWRVGREASARAGRRRVAPMHEIVTHVARSIDDADATKFWPEARRAIRQAALDGEIKSVDINPRIPATTPRHRGVWSAPPFRKPIGNWQI